MTNTELVLNMLAEAATTDLSRVKEPKVFQEHADIAHEGGKVAQVARQQLESQLGHSVISSLNAKTELRLNTKSESNEAEE